MGLRVDHPARIAAIGTGMATKETPGLEGRLERSCRDDRGWLRAGPPVAGVERIEAFFRGRAYAPHRHDTYAIGYTIAGAQCFDYRGETRASLPGNVIVLHPDELHDGRAGTDGGFRYRMIYVEPALIGAALGGKPLPFVGGGVSADPRLSAAVQVALDDFLDPLDDLRRDEILASLAETLDRVADGHPRAPIAVDASAIGRTREYLAAHLHRSITSRELESVAGIDRWGLARQFRAACGTSPHRYLVMRRLDRARSLIVAGSSLAEAAAEAGFADQSHMSRHFKRAYGLPPGRWAALNRTERPPGPSCIDPIGIRRRLPYSQAPALLPSRSAP
jgi:AraC-like DNA-binding protein